MTGKFSQRAICWLMRLTTYAVVFVVGFIVFEIIWRGAGAISWEFLFTEPRRSGAEGGILPAIVGTLLLVAGSIVLAFPLGVATAIYLSEYARQGRFTRAIRVAIATLAGVPSIVFGLFGLGLFVIFLKWGCSILSGCATLACMILPIIIVSSEESLRAVPQSLREGSLALGATKWQTIWSNVLPYSVGGMLTGSILAIGRAAGETSLPAGARREIRHGLPDDHAHLGQVERQPAAFPDRLARQLLQLGEMLRLEAAGEGHRQTGFGLACGFDLQHVATA